MANLVNLQEFDKSFRKSVEALRMARAHMGLTDTYMAQRPQISQVNMNRTTAEMREAVNEALAGIVELQTAVGNLVHFNRDHR